jgi:hypothetical protein
VSWQSLLCEYKFGVCGLLIGVSTVYCEKMWLSVTTVCQCTVIKFFVKEKQLKCFVAASITRWVTWSRDELEEHIWTCQNIMRAANTVTYNMANDDESFKPEMKWQLLATCHTISKQECRTVLLANRVMEFCGLRIGWYLGYSGNHKHHFFCWYFLYKLFMSV